MTLAKLNAAIGKETAFTRKQDRKMFAHFVTWTMFIVCVCPDLNTEWSCFCLDPAWSPRVLAEVNVLGNCSAATGQQQLLGDACQISSY